jgi:hypothetical protein
MGRAEAKKARSRLMGGALDARKALADLVDALDEYSLCHCDNSNPFCKIGKALRQAREVLKR